VCEWFGLKTTRTVFTGLASKPVATVFSSLASKLLVTVFPGLDLKTDSSGLVIWASKSPPRFFALRLKTKQASVCRLRHKTNGERSVRDTRRDLAACLVWKQVWPEDCRRCDDGWCTWHHRGGCIRGKLKIDGSIRRAASNPTILTLPFSLY
jgi:hypothetical protein